MSGRLDRGGERGGGQIWLRARTHTHKRASVHRHRGNIHQHNLHLGDIVSRSAADSHVGRKSFKSSTAYSPHSGLIFGRVFWKDTVCGCPSVVLLLFFSISGQLRQRLKSKRTKSFTISPLCVSNVRAKSCFPPAALCKTAGRRRTHRRRRRHVLFSPVLVDLKAITPISPVSVLSFSLLPRTLRQGLAQLKSRARAAKSAIDFAAIAHL